jgi:hypothetical protein
MRRAMTQQHPRAPVRGHRPRQGARRASRSPVSPGRAWVEHLIRGRPSRPAPGAAR